MSERDYNKQVARRQSIRRTSLVVGVDVGKAYNAVGFMNKEGKGWGSCARVYNSREGFEQFVKRVEDLKAQYALKDVLIGMEPAGRKESPTFQHGVQGSLLLLSSGQHNDKVNLFATLNRVKWNSVPS